MLFYLFIGIIATIFAHLFVSNYDRNRIVSYLYMLLFIIIPSVIEGCRDTNLGTDMLGYGSIYYYNASHYNNIKTFMANLDTKEYAYHLLCYVCSKFGDINFYMFIAALIKMIMLALTCLYFRKKTIVWLAVFGYMLFFYWYGFSLMRQSLALCISMFSLTYLFERKYVLFVIWLMVAYFFHNSAVFMLYMIVVLYMSRFKYRLLYVTIGVAVVYSLASVLFIYIASSGLFGESKMDLYLDSGVASAKTNIVIMVFYILMSFLIKTSDKLHIYYIRTYALLGLMFLMLSNLFEVAFRVSFYQMMPLLFLAPAIIEKEQQKIRKTCWIFLLVCLFLGHFVVAASHGMADTIPYKSIMLDSLL